MKDEVSLRVRPSVDVRKRLWKRAKNDGITYRQYLHDVLTQSANRGVVFQPPKQEKAATKETRLKFKRGTKELIRKLAKASGRSPEEWAIEVLKKHDHDGEG